MAAKRITVSLTSPEMAEWWEDSDGNPGRTQTVNACIEMGWDVRNAGITPERWADLVNTGAVSRLAQLRVEKDTDTAAVLVYKLLEAVLPDDVLTAMTGAQGRLAVVNPKGMLAQPVAVGAAHGSPGGGEEAGAETKPRIMPKPRNQPILSGDFGDDDED